MCLAQGPQRSDAGDPNIRNEIVSESGLDRRASPLEIFVFNETSRIPRINKKSIRGDSGDSWPV